MASITLKELHEHLKQEIRESLFREFTPMMGLRLHPNIGHKRDDCVDSLNYWSNKYGIPLDNHVHIGYDYKTVAKKPEEGKIMMKQNPVKITFLYDNGLTYTAAKIHAVKFMTEDLDGSPCLEYCNHKGCHRVYYDELAAMTIYDESGMVTIQPLNDKVVIDNGVPRMPNKVSKTKSPLTEEQKLERVERKALNHIKRVKLKSLAKGYGLNVEKHSK